MRVVPALRNSGSRGVVRNAARAVSSRLASASVRARSTAVEMEEGVEAGGEAMGESSAAGGGLEGSKGVEQEAEVKLGETEA